MLAFREKARPKMNIEVKDKKDFVNIAKKFNIAERHVTKIQDQKLLNMVSYQYFGVDFASLEYLRLRIFWTNFTICQILAEFLVWGKIRIVTRNQWRDLWMRLNSYNIFLSKGCKSWIWVFFAKYNISMDSMKRLLVNQWVGYTHTCFDGSILDCLR